MLVKDIMNTNVKVAHQDTKVCDVAMIMCLNKISGMPVVGKDNTIIGILSEKDILKAMYPKVDEYMQIGSYDFEELETEYRDVLNLKVKDLMKPGVFTVAPEAPVLKAVSTMCIRKIRRIPVAVDKKLVGVVSMGDVHKAIFKQHLDVSTSMVMVGEA